MQLLTKKCVVRKQKEHKTKQCKRAIRSAIGIKVYTESN